MKNKSSSCFGSAQELGMPMKVGQPAQANAGKHQVKDHILGEGQRN